QLVSAHGNRSDTVRHVLPFSTVNGPPHHEGRPIHGGDEVSQFCHAYRVQAGAAAQVDQSAAPGKRGVQRPPHVASHVLNLIVVAAWSIIVGGDAVKGVSRIVQ